MHLHDRYQMQSEYSPMSTHQLYKIQDYSKDYFSLRKAPEGKYEGFVLCGYQADALQLKEKNILVIEPKIQKM